MTSFAAVFTLIFSSLLFNEQLTTHQVVAFVILVFASLLISQEKSVKRKSNSKLKAIFLIFIANIIFGLSYSVQSYVLSEEPFWNSFIWMRIFGFGATLSLLLVPSIRKASMKFLKTSNIATRSIFAGNQFIAFIAFLLLSYALSIGSAPLINSLQGVQFVFLFVFVLVLSRHKPKVFKEDLTRKIVIQKTLGIILISCAVAILAFN